ncbi:MAG TPA: dihydrofolate reductase family protein [Terriglobales bacterium]|nr:dihydrofolate reductase family protein [Terriglobales bacterium]
MRLDTLWEAPARGPAALPEALQRSYGGDLRLPSGGRSPYVVANFVSSADGVASYQLPRAAGGGTISGNDAGDRFTMGLLRAASDAVIVGASTLRAAGRLALWHPGYTCPAARAAFTRWRAAEGRPEWPLLVVVTRSGDLDPGCAALQAPAARVLILTSSAGAERLQPRLRRVRAKVQMRVVAAGGHALPVAAMVGLLRREFAVRRLLHEGGPTLFGEFLAAGALHELFLTIAPRLSGRSLAAQRPGIIAGQAFSPAGSPRLRPLSVKSHAGLLLLRYAVVPAASGAGKPSSRRSSAAL